jgi:hypothetical protein
MVDETEDKPAARAPREERSERIRGRGPRTERKQDRNTDTPVEAVATAEANAVEVVAEPAPDLLIDRNRPRPERSDRPERDRSDRDRPRRERNDRDDRIVGMGDDTPSFIMKSFEERRAR